MSFGKWMQKSRDLRGLALDEVAGLTKLPARLIAALESDDVDALPDVTYALKYARAAADAIGLDPEDAALRYEEWRAAQPPPTMPPPPGFGRSRAWRLWARSRAIAARVSVDPFVWIAVAVTAGACAAMLWRR
jgi:cytoskeletal protein RodZ